MDYYKASVVNNRFSARKFDIISIIFTCFFIGFVGYVYLYLYKATGIKPLYWYGSIAAYAIFVAAILAAKRSKLRFPIRHPIAGFYIWLIVYLFYVYMLYFWGPGVEHKAQYLISATEITIVSVCTIYLITATKSVRLVVAALTLLAVMVSIINVWDFASPTFSKVPGRAAGLYENPTIAGNVLVLMMPIAVLSVRPRLRLWFCLLCGLGVLATFSRGVWIVWCVGFGLLVYFNVVHIPVRRSQKLLLGLIVVVVFLGFLFSGGMGHLAETIGLDSYLTENTKARLGIGAEVISGYSVEQRVGLVWYSFQQWAEAPLLGHGLSATQSWGLQYRPHNMFLLFLVEGGIFGLIVFLSLFFVIGLRKNTIVLIFAVQYAVSSMFTHNNLEQPAVLMLLSLVVVYSAGTDALVHGKENRKQMVRKKAAASSTV